MMRRLVIGGISLFLLIYGLLLGWRLNGSVVAEKVSPSGLDVIRVRALQQNPASINGLLGLGENVYRCELYLNRARSIFSCLSYTGESFFPDQVEINWKESATAVVILDEDVRFECNNGEWRHVDP